MAITKGSLKPINTKKVSSSAADEEEEEEVEPLSPGARLFHTPVMNCFIIAEIGCKSQIDVEVIKEGVKQTMLKHPRFCSKLVFDANGKAKGWVRTQVNPDEHFIVPDVDPNMDSPDQFVEDYVSNITKTSMNFSRPLWEVHILQVKTSKANGVGIFRIHHSIGDGIALVSLLLACTRKVSDPNAVPSLPVGNKNKNKNKALESSGGGYFGLLGYFLILLWNTLVDLFLFMASVICLKDTITPLKGNPETGKAPKRFVNRTLSFDDIKLIKNSMNTTINDVVLGITQSGLSRYLNRSYGKVKEDDEMVQSKNNLPKHIRLRSTLLVNLRPTTTIEGLAEMMEGDSKRRWQWGNAIAYILLPFHIELKDDPLDYIRDAKATIDRKKQSLEAPSTYMIAKLFLNVMGLWVTSILTSRVLYNTTMSFSNVVGPTEEITFYGHRMAYLAPSVYGHPQALTIHFQSYMDKMTLVVAVDPDVISDPHKFCDDIEESLRLAKDAIVERNIEK